MKRVKQVSVDFVVDEKISSEELNKIFDAVFKAFKDNNALPLEYSYEYDLTEEYSKEDTSFQQRIEMIFDKDISGG